eukprot:CAMPEP_0175116630 /NCGR_PEP_ID=MMETSP0086_2-20121207/18331_1 /TAXON_ID=136419 /ORGANISM="Unknown Unknown, Strain D1" /LENGTH=67 /DNA_ID=CAMNT_0016397037 /DNA_START=37 /DNA_END=240 /DNA_ORIENTATION=-
MTSAADASATSTYRDPKYCLCRPRAIRASASVPNKTKASPPFGERCSLAGVSCACPTKDLISLSVAE